MKNKFTLLIIAMAIMFGCAKEEPQTTLEPSEFIDEYAGYFVKDLLVYDENNVNSAYFRVYSEDENALNKFLEYNTLVLEVMSQDEGNSLLEAKNDIFSKEAAKAHGKREDLNPENYDLDGPIVNIELITENLVDEATYFKIKVAPMNFNKSTPPPGYEDWINQQYWDQLRWVSQSPHGFIGIVAYTDPYPYWPVVKFQYRSCFIFCTWYDWDGWYYELYDSFYQENTQNKNRIGFLVKRDRRSTVSHANSYYVASQTGNFRGRNCSLGAFDGRNCYIATAPSGSTAFVTDNGLGHLYYTPINGNQCPLPGSQFDGFNCWVAQVPNGTEGFVIDNKHLYVKPDLIFVP